jgi:YggT family protein
MNPMLGIALFLVNKAISILTILIIVRAIMSWVPDLSRKYPDFTRLLDRITDPVIRPFRRVLSPYKTGGLDLSPMLAIIALSIIQGLISRFLFSMVR